MRVAALGNTLTPLDVLQQMQFGLLPAVAAQRSFLLESCGHQLAVRNITEAKLLAMDSRLLHQLLKAVVYEAYLSCIPFKVFTYDMEFTGPPVFTPEGPTEDITEIGVFSPDSGALFSALVRPPSGRKLSPGVAELTGLTDGVLTKDGKPFVEAWEAFVQFIYDDPGPEGMRKGDTAHDRILLLSHGGKLADISLIKWTLEKYGLKLPKSFIFGDTLHLIRDCHRRRPVTIDRHPPSWKLTDLIAYLRVPPTLPAHRAGNDARMTWDALYHTLLRYGDDELSPRDQLVTRFFDEEAKARMNAGATRHCSLGDDSQDTYAEVDMAAAGGGSGDGAPVGAGSELDFDFDDIFTDSDTKKKATAAPWVDKEFARLPADRKTAAVVKCKEATRPAEDELVL